VEGTLEKILLELEMLRKLKMIELVEQGYSQAKLGGALGLSQATVSRMMAGRKPIAFKGARKADADDG